MKTASATSTAPSIAYTARRDDRIRRRSRPRAPEDRRDAGVDAQQQRQDQRPAPERGHQDWAEAASPGVYFDGHFVTSESVFAWKTPLAAVPSTTICRPVLERVGDAAVIDDRDRLVAGVVGQRDAHAGVGGGVAAEREHLAGELHVLARLVAGRRLRDADQRRRVADQGRVDRERAQDGRDHEREDEPDMAPAARGRCRGHGLQHTAQSGPGLEGSVTAAGRPRARRRPHGTAAPRSASWSASQYPWP